MHEGTTFAGFTIIRRLGSGGMGEVYLARHPRLPRQDALKILRPEVSADGEYRERFNREADIAASLWHPHIVGVHDRGEFDGQLWIDMDYIHQRDDLVAQPGRRASTDGERRPDGDTATHRAGATGAGVHAADGTDPQAVSRGHPTRQRAAVIQNPTGPRGQRPPSVAMRASSSGRCPFSSLT